MSESGKPGGEYLADPDTQLMLRFAGGDDSAFDRIVERFRKQVYGIIHRYVQDRALAEDCAQEVFLRVYRMRRSYRASARISTLIYRITTNLCLNAIRDQARRRTVSLDAPFGAGETPLVESLERAAGAPPEEELIAAERAEIVRKAVAGIPGRQRLALILHRFEGLSYAEIAQAMDTNVDAVKALLSRARQSLAEALKRRMEAGDL